MAATRGGYGTQQEANHLKREARDAEARQRPEEEDRDVGPAGELAAVAERDGRRMLEGRRLSIPGAGELPLRALVAIAVFVAVFMAIWLLLWAIAGTAGLILGWIPAAVAGALGVKLGAERAWGASAAEPRRPPGPGSGGGSRPAP